MKLRYLPLVFCLLAPQSVLFASAEDWPQFRGPKGDGISNAENVPTEFDESNALAWKTDLPGRGWSSPVFDGRKIWVTTAVEVFPTEEDRQRILKEGGEEERTFAARQVATHIDLAAVSIDYASGEIQMEIPLASIEDPQTIHAQNSFASPTPVLENGVLYAHFGAFGTFAVDTSEGKLLWERRIDLEHGVGPGSSPLVHEGSLILICDGVDRQFVTALDIATGQEIWTAQRPEMRAEKGDQKKSYNTPIVLTDRRGREQLVCMGSQWLVSYDPDSGEELWRLDHGDGYSVVPRPVYSEATGFVYICTGFNKPELVAVRPDGDGDITGTDLVAWREAGRIPARPSPLLHGDDIYVISDGGIASCLDAKTGETHWTERIDGNYSSSPLYADGHIYVASHEGVVTVIKPSRTFEVVAKNQLDGMIMASPIALDGNLIVRTGTYLYRFSN